MNYVFMYYIENNSLVCFLFFLLSLSSPRSVRRSSRMSTRSTPTPASTASLNIRSHQATVAGSAATKASDATESPPPMDTAILASICRTRDRSRSIERSITRGPSVISSPSWPRWVSLLITLIDRAAELRMKVEIDQDIDSDVGAEIMTYAYTRNEIMVNVIILTGL